MPYWLLTQTEQIIGQQLVDGVQSVPPREQLPDDYEDHEGR